MKRFFCVVVFVIQTFNFYGQDKMKSLELKKDSIIQKIENKTYTNNTSDLNELKSFIRFYIQNYCREYAVHHRKLIVAYSGDYIRLLVCNKDGTMEKRKYELYDFSKVYDFQEISKRWGNKGYLNIWTKVYSKEGQRWIKFKLVLLVHGLDKAAILQEALKEYNRVLNLNRENS